jgi:hypothetical protein
MKMKNEKVVRGIQGSGYISDDLPPAACRLKLWYTIRQFCSFSAGEGLLF